MGSTGAATTGATATGVGAVAGSTGGLEAVVPWAVVAALPEQPARHARLDTARVQAHRHGTRGEDAEGTSTRVAVGTARSIAVVWRTGATDLERDLGQAALARTKAASKPRSISSTRPASPRGGGTIVAVGASGF